MKNRVFKFLLVHLKTFIMTDMRKPRSPIAKIPMMDIFAVALNSEEDGFLRICHTLTHCLKNEFILSIIYKSIIEDF